MNIMRRRMYLQLFAADPGAAGGEGGAGGAGEGEAATLTPESVTKQVEDARAAAKAEAQADFERQLAQKLEESKTEAAKLAKMTADEKAAHELQKREDALAAKEQEVAQRELKAETLKTLTDKGLPAGVLDLVIGKDAEDTAKRVDTFKTTFDAAVQQVVDERLRGKSPSLGSGSSAAGSAEEQARATFANALKGV